MSITDQPVELDIGPLVRGSIRPLVFTVKQKDAPTVAYSLSSTTRLLLLVKVTSADADADALLTYDSTAGSPTITIDDAAGGVFHVTRAVGDLADRKKFPTAPSRWYSVREYPSEDIIARGRWLVAESGIDHT